MNKEGWKQKAKSYQYQLQEINQEIYLSNAGGNKLDEINRICNKYHPDISRDDMENNLISIRTIVRDDIDLWTT